MEFVRGRSWYSTLADSCELRGKAHEPPQHLLAFLQHQPVHYPPNRHPERERACVRERERE